MSAYSMIVNDVRKYENNVLCLARIDNYQHKVNRVAIGESITTEPIQLNFHDSIGRSNWILIFYPKGQYIRSSNSVILESGKCSMDLNMVDCKNQDESLAMTIKFFIKSPYYGIKDEFACRRDATFLHRDLSKRWDGPFNLVSTEDLYSKRCENLFLNDSLTIGCELNEAISSYKTWSLSSTMEWSVGNTDTLSSTYKYADKDDVNGRSQKIISSRRSSSDFHSDALKTEKKELHGRFQVIEPKKNITRGSRAWHHKLLQSCNEKTAKNLSSEEPELSKDTGYQAKVKEAIEFFEKISIARD